MFGQNIWQQRQDSHAGILRLLYRLLLRKKSAVSHIKWSCMMLFCEHFVLTC